MLAGPSFLHTCRWHVGSLSVRRSSAVIVNVFFGSLVLQASEQQIGVFSKHGGFEVNLDQIYF